MSSGISKDGILNIVPPNSIDAEKALLSAILIDNSQANSVLGIINPEDFYDSVNAKIFRIISKLSEKNEPIDKYCRKQSFFGIYGIRRHYV